MWKLIDNTYGDCHIGVDVQSGGYYNLAADYGAKEQHTFLQRGSGPVSQFGKAMPSSAKKGLVNWKKCYGTIQAEWPFNTKCCGKANTKAGPPNDYICGEHPSAESVV